MKEVSPLFSVAHKGDEFHKAVVKRLDAIRCSMNRFCNESAIHFSTTTRWAKGSKPDTETINLVEKTLTKLERKAKGETA